MNCGFITYDPQAYTRRKADDATAPVVVTFASCVRHTDCKCPGVDCGRSLGLRFRALGIQGFLGSRLDS